MNNIPKQVIDKAIKTAKASNVIRGKVGATIFTNSGHIITSAHNAVMLGKIEEDTAINPPTRKVMPDSKSNNIEKATGLSMLTFRKKDINASIKKSMINNDILTFRTQTANLQQPCCMTTN